MQPSSQRGQVEYPPRELAFDYVKARVRVTPLVLLWKHISATSVLAFCILSPLLAHLLQAPLSGR